MRHKNDFEFMKNFRFHKKRWLELVGAATLTVVATANADLQGLSNPEIKSTVSITDSQSKKYLILEVPPADAVNTTEYQKSIELKWLAPDGGGSPPDNGTLQITGNTNQIELFKTDGQVAPANSLTWTFDQDGKFKNNNDIDAQNKPTVISASSSVTWKVAFKKGTSSPTSVPLKFGFTGFPYTDGKTLTLLPVELKVKTSSLTLLEENTLRVEGTDNIPAGLLTNVKFEIKRDGKPNWYDIQTGNAVEFKGKARVAGKFKVRATLNLNGTNLETEEKSVEVKFPSYADISVNDDVDAQRSADWNAASGSGGDHNERGGWIYLDTKKEKYSFVQWPIGNFFEVTASPAHPTESVTPADVVPNTDANYFVGEYHLHPTLRNQEDITNAAQFPPGPTGDDQNGANASVSPGGAPGLLRDRRQDEIIATGYKNFPYGPSRRETP